MRTIAAIVALIATLLLSACSSSPPATTTESGSPEPVPTIEQSSPVESPTEKGPDSTATLEWFELVATNDPEPQMEAAKKAAPDSLAAAWVTQQADVNQSWLDEGIPTEPDMVEPTDDGYKTCRAQEDGTVCTEFASIELRDGRVANFTVKKKKLDGRLALGQGDKVRLGSLATAEFLSSYKTATSEDLYVNLRVRSKTKDIDLNSYSAAYREPSGRQVKAEIAHGPSELVADSHANVTIVFRRAKPGGVVTFAVSDAKTLDEAAAKIKVG
jgi:hypothetical protein